MNNMVSFSSLQPQEFPAYVRVSPLHFANGSPRTCRTPVPNAISPDGGRIVARRRCVFMFCLTVKLKLDCISLVARGTKLKKLISNSRHVLIDF